MKNNQPAIPHDPAALERWLGDREDRTNGVKPAAKARIIWNRPEHPRKTPYSLVYLHGFKASRGEGHPLHRDIARRFGCNLFLPRLSRHGLQTDTPLADLTADSLAGSAETACRIGQRIGEQVILMGTSAGGSLALYLAAHPQYGRKIAGLILYAPLIKFYGIRHHLLTSSPGRKLLKVIPGKNYLIPSPAASRRAEEIWYSRYSMQGLLSLGTFIGRYMQPSTFSAVGCPAFIGYYYKNRQEQDTVVSVDAIKKMAAQLGTSGDNIHLQNFPDAGTHILPSELYSNSLDIIRDKTAAFMNLMTAENR